jgi:chromate transporter
LAKVVAWGAVLWCAPMAWLIAVWGWDHALAQMGWFFTKAAWLTFGGAYAVLPYVVQGAVDQYAWLTAPQMMDGLALGESTPGPLIMVVAFVGFLGGVAKEVLGPDAVLASGALAACVVTWFTFLPSFILILAGGPWIESTHGQLKFTAPLTAITAAVVGAVLTLALFFLSHVGWPEGFSGRMDTVSLMLCAAAGVALMYFKRSVIEVIAVSALVGWAWFG